MLSYERGLDGQGGYEKRNVLGEVIFSKSAANGMSWLDGLIGGEGVFTVSE